MPRYLIFMLFCIRRASSSKHSPRWWYVAFISSGSACNWIKCCPKMWSTKCRMPQMQGTRRIKQWEQCGKGFQFVVACGCSSGFGYI